MPEYFIGTSGWYYKHWYKLFYPENMAKSRWLEFYAQNFNTVELNNTFYRLPDVTYFKTWQSTVPRDFIYSVKVSRFITHIKRLKNLDDAIDRFISRVILLDTKLGPLLYQLPPRMKKDSKLLADFLALLPTGYRHVFEFRDKSWLDDEIFILLRQNNAGFCIYDMPEFTTPVITTADFSYVRFHGSTALYGSSYSPEELGIWADKIENIGSNLRNIYIYFNNDSYAFAVENAKSLKKLLIKSTGF